MNKMLKLIWQCLYSPRLYKIYGDGEKNLYQPKKLETFGDKIITTGQNILTVAGYTSPFMCTYVYRRGFFSWEETIFLSKFFTGIGCLLAFSFLIRAVGRAFNLQYCDFLRAITSSRADEKAYLTTIRKYDFEFAAWPISFAMPAKPSTSWLERIPFNKCSNTNLPIYQRVPLQIIAFVAVHTFAMRLIYPGTLSLIQNLLWVPLLEGRTQLVQSYHGKRAKILTSDANSIDTIFIDNRAHSNGKFLVICCEGNSGFYEIGIITTPIKAGYSALGWNHPGFAGSTGMPFPNQEQNSINAVIQYAVDELKFPIGNIIIYGWSIGGYTAAWAACNYPEIKALVLDATFDDLLPLAQNQMPRSWSLLVKEVVRSYVDLNVGEFLIQYKGPVQLIRRTEDEVICLRQGQLETNCGNNLLIKLLQSRYPPWFREGNALREALERYVAMTEAQRATIDQQELSETNRRALQLIIKYMRDFQSTHCSPLHEAHFADVMKTIHLKD